LKLSYIAEYCDTPQSKDRSNREYKLYLDERAILRLLDALSDENGAVMGDICAPQCASGWIVKLVRGNSASEKRDDRRAIAHMLRK
jgi:hypothetical protein